MQVHKRPRQNEPDREKEVNLKKIVFSQKYRFDLGYQFMAIMNFVLLLITASEKIKSKIGISRTWLFVVLSVVCGLGCVWLFGYFLDKVIRYSQSYSMELVSRNPNWWIQMRALQRIEKKLGIESEEFSAAERK